MKNCDNNYINFLWTVLLVD